MKHVTLAAAGAFALLAALPATAHEHHANSGPPAEVAAANGKVTVVGKEFKFVPSAIKVEKGQKVTIVFKDEGRLSHNLTIPGLEVHTPTIQSGNQAKITFTVKKTGTYPFWCTVPGHKQAGMTGEVDVAP